MKRSISSSFIVNTVEDGQSAPFYNEEWFAWSNDPTTASVTDEPHIAGEWSKTIPSQGSYAYLWKKVAHYDWDDTARSYTLTSTQYFRMSGTNGTSINIKGAIDYAASSSSGFPTASSSLNNRKAIAKADSRIWRCQQVAQNTYDWVPNAGTASDGYSYTIGEGTFNGSSSSASNLNGHLVMWSTEAEDWVDLGQFKGEPGVTYYTHIAWASSVSITARGIVVIGFVTVKLPADTMHPWMGVLVDTNPGQDPNNAERYVWTNTKGQKGDKGDKGDVGRFFYYAGVWSEIASEDTFEVSDAQAPYFRYGGTEELPNYWVFNPATNGTYSKAQMGTPSSSAASWEQMASDFKYIITQALFSRYAHLGSWIFNGDFMLSQTGADGTENYTQFTGEGSTWQPNLYMNAKTGKLVSNSGVIGGFTINNSQIKSSNSSIVLNSDGSAKIGGFDIAANGAARLKNTLSVGNANSQRIEIAPFAQGGFGAGSINFVNMNGEKVIVLGFNNGSYGHIDILKAATNQDVVESTMSIGANSLQINSQNTDYNTDANINILTNSNNALSMFSYNEPSETQKLLKCGIENKTITLRAYKSDGSSAWPSVGAYPGTRELTKGLVHVMSIANLKAILDDTTSYWYQWSKYYVLLVQHIN